MTLKIKEPILTVDVVNDNNRIYPKAEVEKAINKFNEKHKTVGCLCDNMGTLETNLARVSHTVDYLELVDDNVMAEMTILDTPYGKLIQELLDDGVKLSVSSQGTGVLRGKEPYIIGDYSFTGSQIT